MDLEWERENPRDNVIAGTVGAFLGSLTGVACIVIFNKLGYVSAVSGVVMAVCTIKGYALLGGKLTRRGAVISGLFILVMTYIATKLCFALAVMEVATEEVSFFLIYQSIGLFLEDSELRRIFLGELALQYLFTLVGGIPTLTFQPYDVLPVQVQNTGASSRDRRMNPTKTVYTVHYRATDGSGYKWSNEAFSKDHGQRVVETGETVERRVLRIPADKTYITVEPEQSAGSYTAGLRQKYTTILALAGAYVLLYGLGWCVLIWMKKAKRGSQVW